MKKLITEIVEKAMHVYFDSNQDESSKRKFYSTHSKSILFEYEKVNFKFYDGVSFNAVLRRKLLNIGIFKEKMIGITFHGIRRMLDTKIIKQAYPVDMVAQVLRHKSIRSTRRYISLNYQGLKKCALSFNALSDKL